nr:prevent-host-death family protein [Streptococcus thermophilus]
MTTISSRDFNHDVGAAKRAALDGPVVITERGEPSHVLLSIETYRKLQGDGASFVRKLRMSDPVDAEFERVDLEFRVPEF